MLSSKGEAMASIREKQFAQKLHNAGTSDFRRMCTMASLSEQKRMCLLNLGQFLVGKLTELIGMSPRSHYTIHL